MPEGLKDLIKVGMAKDVNVRATDGAGLNLPHPVLSINALRSKEERYP